MTWFEILVESWPQVAQKVSKMTILRGGDHKNAKWQFFENLR